MSHNGTVSLNLPSAIFMPFLFADMIVSQVQATAEYLLGTVQRTVLASAVAKRLNICEQAVSSSALLHSAFHSFSRQGAPLKN